MSGRPLFILRPKKPDESINFYFQPTDAIKRFVINNDIGQTLKIESSRLAPASPDASRGSGGEYASHWVYHRP